MSIVDTLAILKTILNILAKICDVIVDNVKK